MRLEQTILRNLIYNDEFLRKTLPFLKSEYFVGSADKVLFEEIQSFVDAYTTAPSIEAIELAVKENRKITEDVLEECQTSLKEIHEKSNEVSNLEWLIDKTELFCQEKAIYNSVLKSITILDGKDQSLDKGSIPKLLQDALSVSFDNSVGHDYLDDSDARYEFYHRHEERIPFDLEYFNKITKGGLPNKTLNIALAEIGRAHV